MKRWKCGLWSAILRFVDCALVYRVQIGDCLVFMFGREIRYTPELKSFILHCGMCKFLSHIFVRLTFVPNSSCGLWSLVGDSAICGLSLVFCMVECASALECMQLTLFLMVAHNVPLLQTCSGKCGLWSAILRFVDCALVY